MAEKAKSTTSKTTVEEEFPPITDSNYDSQLFPEIDEMFGLIDTLSEGPQKDTYNYLAAKLTKHGWACIRINELDDTSRLFNRMQLLNDSGSSKHPRLDTIKRYAEAKRANRKPELGDSTATELVTDILNRAGLPDSPQKDDLIKFFARALLINIPDPVRWQNPFWDLGEPDTGE